MTTFFIKTLDEKYVNLVLYNLIYVKKIDNSFAIVCQNTKETIVLDKYETEDQAKEIMNDLMSKTNVLYDFAPDITKAYSGDELDPATIN